MLMPYAVVVLLALILTGPADAQIHVDSHGCRPRLRRY
jgi:hypothetical protein